MTKSSSTRSLPTGTPFSGPGLEKFLQLERIYLNQRDKLAVAARLKEARQLAGFSEPEMAELLEPAVRDRTIRNYEAGRVPTKYLRQWAELTGVSFEWLLTGKGETSAAEERASGGSVEARLDRIEQLLEALVVQSGQGELPAQAPSK